MLTFKRAITEINLSQPKYQVPKRIKKCHHKAVNDLISSPGYMLFRRGFAIDKDGPFHNIKAIYKLIEIGILKRQQYVKNRRVILTEFGKEYIEFLKWRMKNE